MMYLLGPLRGGIHTIAASVAIAVLACACACARSAGAEIVAPYTDADLVSDVTVQTEGFLDIQADAVERGNSKGNGNSNSNETQQQQQQQLLSPWNLEEDDNFDSIDIGNNETTTTTTTTISAAEVGSNLLDLLGAHDLDLMPLISMFIGTYWADDPRDSDYGCSPRMKDCESLPTYWKAEVVTPVPQGVNGSLVQAVLFSNEHRNPDNPQRVLSFAGAMLWGTGVRDDQTAIPDGACLAAMYQFKDTTFAEATWQHLCFQNGYTVPDVAAWAEQIEALVEKTKPTFLTGHKLGCDIALTVGLLNPTLPVVCWSSTGTLNPAWIEAYPGLSEAIDAPGGGNATDSDSDSGNDNSSDSDNYNGNDNMYVLQRLTDPTSNCLLPEPLPGTGVANVCVYDHPNPGLRCDPGNNNMPFDTAPWSDCSMRTSSVMGLGMGTQNIDFERDCMPKQDIGIDFRLRDCPYEGYYVEEVEEVDPKDDAAAAADDDDQGSSGGSASFLPRVSLSVSFLLVAALELYGCFVDTR